MPDKALSIEIVFLRHHVCAPERTVKELGAGGSGSNWDGRGESISGLQGVNINGTRDESCSKEVGVAWVPFYLERSVVCRRELLCGYSIVVAPPIRSRARGGVK